MDTDIQINAVEHKIERGMRTVFNHEGLELKKTLMVSLGNFNPYRTEIQIDSASAVSFMKIDLLHELKIRDRFLKLERMEELTKKAYQGFGSTINTIGRVRVRIRSKGWDASEEKLYRRCRKKSSRKRHFTEFGNSSTPETTSTQRARATENSESITHRDRIQPTKICIRQKT